MYKPLVSVIIPAYNVEAYIAPCLGSVLAQSYPKLEIICVDNNSTDNTLQKLEALREKHPEIILLTEEKQGAPAARNAGLHIAKGEWIQFLDADDILLPGKISRQVSLLENAEVGFIAGASVRVSPDQ